MLKPGIDRSFGRPVGSSRLLGPCYGWRRTDLSIPIFAVPTRPTCQSTVFSKSYRFQYTRGFPGLPWPWSYGPFELSSEKAIEANLGNFGCLCRPIPVPAPRDHADKKGG